MATILAFGYHDQQAQRHWTLCRKWRETGKEVIECHTTARGLFAKYRDLFRQFQNKAKDADTVVATFPGHYLVPLAWVLTRYPRKTLVFDAFISLWDTLVDDRKKYPRWHPLAWCQFAVDCISCHLADEVLVDTEANRRYFIETFKLKPAKVKVEYLGTRTDIFYPRSLDLRHSTFDILFFGSYIPLQGIEHIVAAAGILEPIAPDIRFTLIGSGQTRPQIERLIRRKNIRNISLKTRISMEELPDHICRSHLCLGIFGTSGKAGRVIPHKVYDTVACGVPVLTADTPAIRELFGDHPLVHLCQAGDPRSIAEAIHRLSTASK